MLVLPVACGSDEPSDDGDGGGAGSSGAPGGSSGAAGSNAGSGGTEAGSAGATAGSGGSAAGRGGAPSLSGAGGSDAGSGGSDAGAGGREDVPHFPCDVEDAIQAKCQRCHNEPQLNGAPFALLTWEDTQANYGVELVYERMLPAIETGFMPFMPTIPLDPPVQPLTADEKELLLTWLRSGAPPAYDVVCD